jgi:hypothetical protein
MEDDGERIDKIYCLASPGLGQQRERLGFYKAKLISI